MTSIAISFRRDGTNKVSTHQYFPHQRFHRKYGTDVDVNLAHLQLNPPWKLLTVIYKALSIYDFHCNIFPPWWHKQSVGTSILPTPAVPSKIWNRCRCQSCPPPAESATGAAYGYIYISGAHFLAPPMLIMEHWRDPSKSGWCLGKEEGGVSHG